MDTGVTPRKPWRVTSFPGVSKGYRSESAARRRAEALRSGGAHVDIGQWRRGRWTLAARLEPETKP